jgi:hypothetical protein
MAPDLTLQLEVGKLALWTALLQAARLVSVNVLPQAFEVKVVAIVL